MNDSNTLTREKVEKFVDVISDEPPTDQQKTKERLQRPGERSLSPGEMQLVQKFPCDGIVRYSVKGCRTPGETYGAAYEGLIAITQCGKNPDGGTRFSAEGLRRISALNRAYIKVAAEFVKTTMHRENMEQVKILRAALRRKEAEAIEGIVLTEAQKETQKLFGEGKISLNDLRASIGRPRIEDDHLAEICVPASSDVTDAPRLPDPE